MRLVGFLSRHPFLVLVVAFLVCSSALISARKIRLETNLVGLLPSDSAAADDYRTFLRVFGGLEKVYVLVRPPENFEGDAQSLVTEAARELSTILENSQEVRWARAGIQTEDEDFFLRYVVPRAILLLGEDWEQELRRRIDPTSMRDRAAEIRAAVFSPFGPVHLPVMKVDPLGFSEALPGYKEMITAMPVDPISLTFLSDDGTASLVIMSPARSEIDPEGGRALQGELDSAYAEVNRQLGVRCRFSAVGGPLYAATDEAILRGDLKRTVTGSAIGCSALLVAAFGGVAIPLGVLLAVAAGLAATTMWLAFAVESLSALSIGFAAVLVGLGIDYGIHLGTRFQQFQAVGESIGKAAVLALRAILPAILTSTATTMAAFLVLMLSELRPLRDLGIVVAAGIFFVMISSLVVCTAAAAAATPATNGRSSRRFVWVGAGKLVDHAVRIGEHNPKSVLFLTGVLTAVCMFGMIHLQIEPDLRAVRPSDHPMQEAEAQISGAFKLGLDTATVILAGTSLPDVLHRGARLDRILRSELPATAEIIYGGRSLGDPSRIEARLYKLGTIDLAPSLAGLRSALLEQGLNPAGFEPGFRALQELDQGRDPGFPNPLAWPPWLSEMIRSVDGRNWIALNIRRAGGEWPDGPPESFVRRLSEVEPTSAVASVPAIGRDIRRLAMHDLKILSGAAIACVFGIVLVSFRGKIGDALVSLTPVALGIVWSLGIWGLLGNRLDVVSVAVVPILIGIGIDDGLHAVHGARGGSSSDLAESVRVSGRAMVLTTLTTCVGFGSLTLSHVPGLRSGGILVAAGTVACLFATLVVLPAIHQVRRIRS